MSIGLITELKFDHHMLLFFKCILISSVLLNFRISIDISNYIFLISTSNHQCFEVKFQKKSVSGSTRYCAQLVNFGFTRNAVKLQAGRIANNTMYVFPRCQGTARTIDGRPITDTVVDGANLDVENAFCYLGDMLSSGSLDGIHPCQLRELVNHVSDPIAKILT